MNRRDFLLLKTDRSRRVAELSCERLYMRLLDVEFTSGATDVLAQAEPWDGEPPSSFKAYTARHLFDQIARELQRVQILRVLDRRWLASDVLKREFDTLLDAFRSRGGRVVFQDVPYPDLGN